MIRGADAHSLTERGIMHAAVQTRLAQYCVMHRLGEVGAQLFPKKKHRLINLMVDHIDLVAGGLKLKGHELSWQALIGEFTEGTISHKLLDRELVQGIAHG